MFSQFSYPIICTEKYAETVGFYEDHFEYSLAMEMNGFAILKRANWPDMFLAVMDSTHPAIPEHYRRPVHGMILNMPVASVDNAHQEAYWEGLKIVSEPAPALCGRKHFFIEDPNGLLIDVAENLPLESVMGADEFEALCMVA